jgi:hypothetical protein
MSLVEIRTIRVGTGKSSRMTKQVLVDGNDISADVLAVDVHLDGKGNDIATVTLVAQLMETELAIVELTEETKFGLLAMGWRTMNGIRKILSAALDDLEDNTNEADGRLDFSAAQAVLSDALADLERGSTL